MRPFPFPLQNLIIDYMYDIDPLNIILDPVIYESLHDDSIKRQTISEFIKMLITRRKIHMQYTDTEIVVFGLLCRHGLSELVIWICNKYNLRDKVDVPFLVSAATCTESLKSVKLLCEQLDIIKNRSSGNINSMFAITCKIGNLRICSYLHRKLNLYPDGDVQYPMNEVLASGSIRNIKWMCKTFDIRKWNLLYTDYFKHVASSGNLVAVKYIYGKFGYIDGSSLVSAFEESCIRDHLSVSKWLFKKMETLNSEWKLHVDFRCVITMACKKQFQSSLRTIKWMCDKLSVSKNALLDPSRIFTQICESNRKDMAIWFRERFNLSREECLGQYCAAFIEACSNGSEDTAWWLYTEFKMTRKECAEDNWAAFYNNVRRKDFSIARWLHEEFKIKKEEINLRSIYKNLIGNDKLDNLKWLHQEFGFERKTLDINPIVDFTDCCKNKHFKDAMWIMDTFKLSPDESAEGFITMCEMGDMLTIINMYEKINSSAELSMRAINVLMNRGSQYTDIARWIYGLRPTLTDSRINTENYTNKL